MNKKEQKDIAMRWAVKDAQTEMAWRAFEIWSASLTEDQRQWLLHTSAGNNERWRRLGLAQDLCAPLPPK